MEKACKLYGSSLTRGVLSYKVHGWGAGLRTVAKGDRLELVWIFIDDL